MIIRQAIIDWYTFFSRQGRSWYARGRAYALAHKAISAFVAVALFGTAWYAYAAMNSTSGQARYVLGNAEQGTIVASVTGSGQVSASQELDLKPKVSGQIVSVGVEPGQHVAAGTLVAEIDPTDAQRAVRDARTNLQSAKLALAKLTEPADAVSSAEAADAVTGAYASARSDLVSTYLDLQNTMADLKSINSRVEGNQFGSWNTGSTGGDSLRSSAGTSYDAAADAYASAFTDYSSVTIAGADDATIERLLNETANTVMLVANAVKGESAYLSWYGDYMKTTGGTPIGSASTDLSTLSSDAGKVGGHLPSLTSDASGVTEKKLSLQKLQSGADTLDVASSQLSVTKAENALADAESTLADYYLRAPFAGTIGSVSAHKYDQAGSGTALATLITTQQVADLSLNEVDAAKIALGDKATLTFDAIPNLTLTGAIAEIDPVGTVTQGVVSYDVKIAFDSQDPRIKTGMTVNASMETAVHADALYVPSSAVKTSAGGSYVLAFDPPVATSTASAQGIVTDRQPVQIPVETGISDDTDTEILSGLSAGEQIVVRTATGAATTARTSTPAAATGGARNGGFGGGAAIRL